MAVVQREELNSYWLPRRSTAGSWEALQRLEQGTPRQGWLIEEEEVAGEGEAFARSSGGTLKLA